MKQYRYHFDVLRVIAALAVVLIHVSDEVITKYPLVSKSYWWIINFGDGIARFAVPVFFMVTGALLLSNEKNEQVTSFYIKRGKRVVIPYIFWSIFYILIDHYLFHASFTKKDAIMKVVYFNSYYHMWFFQGILAVYLLVPFIKSLLQRATEKELRNLIILWIGFQIIEPFVSNIVGYHFPLPNYLITSFLGYAILGYYIEKYQSQILENLGVPLFVIGTIMTITTTYMNLDKVTGTILPYGYETFSLNIFMASVGIYLLVSHLISNDTKQSRIVKKISQLSFGVFLIHPFFLTIIREFLGVNPQIQQNIVGYLGTYLLVLGCSLVTTWCISMIPFVRRII